MLQRTIGNQATLRYLTHRLSNPPAKAPGEHHPTEAAEVARETPRAAWDFSKIPLFPPDQPNRPQVRSSVSAPSPLAGVIQPKLALGEVNDPLEREADRVADQVMRMPAPGVSVEAVPPKISRKCAACEKEDKLQKMPAGPQAASEAPGIVHDVLRSSGQPLDAATRAYFEPRFGYNFSDVRIHTDPLSARSAALLGARAYARGADVVYGAGELQGVSWLTAHELAHVAQSRLVTEPNVIRRAPGGELGQPIQDFKIVSDVWNVEGRSVVVVESGGERIAFYRRSSSELKGRFEGHVGPQKNDWAPFHGFEDNGRGGGYFRKNIFYKGKLSTDPRYGYGSAKNLQTAEWLNKQVLPEGIPEDWTYVQSRLESVGAEGLIPLENPIPERLAPVEPPARTAQGELDVGGGGTPGGGGASSAEPKVIVEPPPVPEPPIGSPFPGGPELLEEPVPSIGARVASGAAEGLKAAFSVENIAAMIPDAVLAIADRVAAREAIRNIAAKFLKEGFAKGVAAGVMGWEAAEVASNLKNRVTPFRVKGLEDPAGILTMGYILKLAEGFENYAVDVGYRFSSSKSLGWKWDMRTKGFAALKKRDYHFESLEYEFIDALARMLRPTTDPIVEQAIEESRERHERQEEQRKWREYIKFQSSIRPGLEG